MDETPLTIVRAPAWQALVRRLDAAVARDPRLVAARDVVLRPVELLRIMAADAHGALADDVLRGDRLRAMLFIAWPYVAVALEVRKLLAAKAPPSSPDTALLAELVKPVAGAAHELAWPASQPYEPGVIDHAGLLVLALAAARVADPPFAPVFVASIHGLALAASAAEVLGRLDPRQLDADSPDADSLDVVLQTLYMTEAARTVTRNESLRPFVFDPVERGRWRCLAELMASPLIETAVRMGRTWDGATSDEIVSVSPRTAGTGDTIVIRVRGGDPRPRATVVFASADGPLHPAEVTLGPVTSDATSIKVVVPDGATPGWIGFSRSDLIGASNKVRKELQGLLAEQLQQPCVDRVRRIEAAQSVPEYGALATPRRRGTNRFEGGVPVVVFVGVEPRIARPGESIEIRWETAGADAVSLAFAGTVETREANPTEPSKLVAPASDGEVIVTVTPTVSRGGRTIVGKPKTAAFTVNAPIKIAAIEVTQQGRTTPLFAGMPLDVTVHLDAPVTVVSAQLVVGDMSLEPTSTDPGIVTFQIPNDPDDLVRDGVTMSATIEDRTGARDTRSVGPLALRAILGADIVLVRPAIVTGITVAKLDAPGATKDLSDIDERLDVATAYEHVKTAAAAVGIAATVVDLPWADDELAVLAGRPDGDSDPMLLRVLEALSRRALVTPRFEHAIWLALLPDPDPRSRLQEQVELTELRERRRAMKAASVPIASIAHWLPANAARAVAVATPSGLARLFAGLYPGDAKPDAPTTISQRLAILGTVDEHELRIDDVRVDERGVGPGAPTGTSLEAVALDASGRELDHVPLRVLGPNQPASLAVLVPVSAAVASVEIRGNYGFVHRVIRRIPGTLRVEDVAYEPPKPDQPAAFTWRWEHDHNARPTVSVVLSRNEIETPVLSVDPCLSRVVLPLWRFAAADSLRLYATDGWNKQIASIGKGFENDAPPVVLRRLGDHAFFADAPDHWTLTWLLDGTKCATNTRTLQLAAGITGLLELVARYKETKVVEVLRIER